MSWSISLPIYEPEVLDNSQAETHARCPRLFLYRYLLRRGPSGTSYPIQFGLAYHKYRETIEKIMLDEDSDLTVDIHVRGITEATVDYEDPPLEHRHSYLNLGRLLESFELAFDRIREEQRRGRIKVVRAEDSFDIPFPDSDERFGGRMDQIIDWSGKLWIRDFKTTSRLGNTYPDQFDPNHQMSGYVWAGTQLSGRPVKGVLIETLYNTKNQGPEFKQFISTRSPGQLEAWMRSIMTEIGDIRRNITKIPSDGYLAFPQRTSACSDYGGCYFRGSSMTVGPCSMQNAEEIERWLEQYTNYSHWDFTDPDKEESKA